MNLLEFDHIKKRFGNNEVLKDISFSITEGDIFGLIGKSGSGKSTLLKILVGMVEADSGIIRFEDKNVLHKLNYLRKNTGFATQGNLLIDELSIKENSFYFGELYGIKRKKIKKRFNELLELLGLEGFGDTLIRNLSGGMEKRANILISLIHKPKLLILDEPTVGLDSMLREVIWKYIHKINEEGTTILIISHLLEEIEENCDKVGVLKDGEIIALATVEQYKNKYGKHKSLNEVFQAILE